MNFNQDRITVKGVQYITESEPLKEFEKEIKETLVTANFVLTEFDREYLAYWEIKDFSLYLIDIKVIIDKKLASVFPADKQSIFANWFTGEIVLKKEKSYISNFLRDHNFTKTHHYFFKEGKQTAFYPIDLITEKDGEYPF